MLRDCGVGQTNKGTLLGLKCLVRLECKLNKLSDIDISIACIFQRPASAGCFTALLDSPIPEVVNHVWHERNLVSWSLSTSSMLPADDSSTIFPLDCGRWGRFPGPLASVLSFTTSPAALLKYASRA